MKKHTGNVLYHVMFTQFALSTVSVKLFLPTFMFSHQNPAMFKSNLDMLKKKKRMFGYKSLMLLLYIAHL